jgi:predicted enzyme related to lactoylglutathione lyase
VNFRVRDLDGLLAGLRAAGVEVSREEEMDGVGRFARVHDPEGNPIELWEPAAPSAA